MLSVLYKKIRKLSRNLVVPNKRLYFVPFFCDETAFMELRCRISPVFTAKFSIAPGAKP